ncbi:hypothetical protein D1614_11905 [Maribellus luteus]|uniref:Uncharacterized protein n=1 Tax=Maribellus luteus TaxID=2305463 RepID=A0A399T2F0_9BACT|nr:hypothetical protein D1614_11905 [Maribellus luteus]
MKDNCLLSGIMLNLLTKPGELCNRHTWYKAWLGLYGFDKSNLVPTSVSVGLVRLSSDRHDLIPPPSECLKTFLHEGIIRIADFEKNEILKSQRLNFTF